VWKPFGLVCVDFGTGTTHSLTYFNPPIGKVTTGISTPHPVWQSDCCYAVKSVKPLILDVGIDFPACSILFNDLVGLSIQAFIERINNAGTDTHTNYCIRE
jgi:hypothetical protein